jgi:hypothetical protein
MAGSATAARSYSGSAPEPVPWSTLEEIFDSMFGHDVRDLRRWPETMHNIYADWTDSRGVEHDANTLDDVRQAYERKQAFA